MRSRLPGPLCRTLAVALTAVAALVLSLGAASCSDDGASPSSSTLPGSVPDDETAEVDGAPITTTESAAAYTAYRDPAQLAADPVAVGERFGILLVAQPSEGRRWRVVPPPPDPAVLVPLGTELTLANAAVPGEPDTQVYSYAGNGIGATEITFEEVHADGTPVEGSTPVTFTATVTPDGLPPPPEASPEGEDGEVASDATGTADEEGVP